MSIKTWFTFHYTCTFCLQTGSSFLSIETKEEKPDTDNGGSNSDSDSVDEGVNKIMLYLIAIKMHCTMVTLNLALI